MSNKHERVAREIASTYQYPEDRDEFARIYVQPILEHEFPEPIDPASLTAAQVCDVLNRANYQSRTWQLTEAKLAVISGSPGYSHDRINLEEARIVAAYLQGRISE